MDAITEKYVQQYIKPRKPETHKGDYGRVLIIAGSLGMGGAAIMCGKAALRSGAGLVTLSVPKELFTAIHSALPEAICIDRGSAQPNTDTVIARSEATRQSTTLALSQYNAIAIGPGLGTSEDTADLLSEIIHAYKGKLILDADALNVIAAKNIPLSDSKADIIITPHPGEAARLLNSETAKINENREASAKELSTRYNAVAVLKGYGPIVANEEVDCRASLAMTAIEKSASAINTTGNPGMATGGSGDVLTGIIAALAAQGLSTFEAATNGVYLHGLAGDIAAEKLGEYSLIASDIIEALPQAFLEIVDR
jgi:NAD(P)H-hydrate epimerase